MHRRPPTPLTLLAAACLALVSSSAAAQGTLSSPASATPAGTLPTVKVTGTPDDYRAPASPTATRTDTPSLETPQSVQVVPRAVIEDQNALTLSEAVRNVSGVQHDFGFNGMLQPLLILRGFSSTSMTAMGSMSGASGYYLDGTKVMGVPVNMANVQSVEVVKGPSSVMYGRAEPGGLVNVVSRPISSVPEFSFEQTLGQYGLSRTAVEASGSLNADRTLRGRVSASYFSADSIRDYVKDRLGAFNGSLAWVPDSRTNITATLDYSDSRYRTDAGIPAIGNRPANLPWSAQFNDTPTLSSAKTTSLRLDASHQINDTWQLKGRFLTLRSDTSELDIYPYRVDLGMGMTPAQTCPGTGNPLCRYYFGVRPDGRYSVDQLNADLVGKFKTGAVSHEVLFGFDTYRTRKTGTTYTQQIDSINIYNPVLGNTPPLDLTMAMPGDFDDYSRWNSFYVQDQIALGNGVSLIGALRYDRTSAVFGVTGTPPNEQSFTTPRLGAIWKFAPNQSVYAQYQDAVAANNGRDTVTGAALAVERARQFEVGHKAELFDRKLSSTIALFHLTKRNRGATVIDPLSPTGTNIVTVGEAVARGLEWDVSGQITRKLSLIASYAYTDGKVTRDPTYQGKKLPNVARNTASLWARYAVDPQWTVGGGVFVQGQREGDSGNTFQLPGYGRLDAMASYRFGLGGGKAALQLNVDNLLNRKYYASSHQFVQDWIKVGTPRTAKVTLRVDY